MILIDGCQYANWSEKIFREMHEGGVSAVHVTICYHEDFRETVVNMADWNRMFERFPNLIVPGRTADDVRGLEAAVGDLPPGHARTRWMADQVARLSDPAALEAWDGVIRFDTK